MWAVIGCSRHGSRSFTQNGQQQHHQQPWGSLVGLLHGCIGATSDVGQFSVVLADAARMKVTVECIAWDVGFCSFVAHLGPATMDSDHFGCSPKQ